ncbi:hypothetical protein PILCRDRAFT_79748, partial [Piloderma croceum F 1598]
PIEKYFPEHTAGPDINEAEKYILWRFRQANRARSSPQCRRQYYRTTRRTRRYVI